jgi:hypothetical protein
MMWLLARVAILIPVIILGLAYSLGIWCFETKKIEYSEASFGGGAVGSDEEEEEDDTIAADDVKA